MALGMVKWFDVARGFGFIRPDAGPCDVFVHASALQPDSDLPGGVRVEFELTQAADGRPSAFAVRRTRR